MVWFCAVLWLIRKKPDGGRKFHRVYTLFAEKFLQKRKRGGVRLLAENTPFCYNIFYRNCALQKRMLEVFILDIIATVIVAIAAVLLFTFIPGLVGGDEDKPKKGKAKAKSGMGKAQRLVSRFAMRQQYKLLGPCRFEKDGKTAEIDSVLIGYFGVLLIKTMGRNGEIYGGEGDAQWLQVVNNQRTYFESPVVESGRAVPMVRAALEKAKVRGVLLETVSVATCKKAQVAVPKSLGLLTLREFSIMLEKQKYLEDKGVNLEQVYNALKPYEI